LRSDVGRIGLLVSEIKLSAFPVLTVQMYWLFAKEQNNLLTFFLKISNIFNFCYFNVKMKAKMADEFSKVTVNA